jgi:hypothetical protein
MVSGHPCRHSGNNFSSRSKIVEVQSLKHCDVILHRHTFFISYYRLVTRLEKYILAFTVQEVFLLRKILGTNELVV